MVAAHSMTSQVIDAPLSVSQSCPMSNRPFHTTASAGNPAGNRLRRHRQQAGLSQLELALLANVSQRHLSCVETGRAKPSPGTLHALLSALDVPLEECNEVFLAAGYAPRYTASALSAPHLAVVHDAIAHILQANNPAPAIVLDNTWRITAANTGATRLLHIAGVDTGSGTALNLLQLLFCPGGLGDALVNAEEVRAIAWQRASREAVGNADLARILAQLPTPAERTSAVSPSPVVLTRLRSSQGELQFLSTFTTFGMPQDITVASLRIEHLIPADAHTWQTMTMVCSQATQLAPTEP
ncbi:anaerobic benzoate catabolism transcriptional regulator [compost metagenome]